MEQIFRFLEMNLTSFEVMAVWLVMGVSFLGLIYALFLRRQILAEDKGTEKMQEVWEAIRQGANAYLTRQLRTILPFIAVLTVALFLSVYIVPPTEFSLEVFAGYSEDTIRLIVGIGRAVAFVMGAVFSLTVGQLGMRMAVEGNVRVANAARLRPGHRAERVEYFVMAEQRMKDIDNTRGQNFVVIPSFEDEQDAISAKVMGIAE